MQMRPCTSPDFDATPPGRFRFYGRQGFQFVTPVEKDLLLRRYRQIRERQVETGVVLTKIPLHSADSEA